MQQKLSITQYHCIAEHKSIRCVCINDCGGVVTFSLKLNIIIVINIIDTCLDIISRSRISISMLLKSNSSEEILFLPILMEMVTHFSPSLREGESMSRQSK